MKNIFNTNNVRVDSYTIDQQNNELQLTLRLTMADMNANLVTHTMPQNDDKGRFSGGGNKPASNKQIDWLCSLAEKKGQNLEALCSSKYQKHSGQLLGREADELIKELKR